MLRMLKYYLRLYFLIESQYIKARMQYRADFVISSIGMVFTGLVTIFVFQVLFDTIPTLAGWTFNEILFIYGFFSLAIAPLQIFFDNIWFLRYKVQDGSFIKYYFRPLNMMFYFMSETVDLKGFTQLCLNPAGTPMDTAQAAPAAGHVAQRLAGCHLLPDDRSVQHVLDRQLVSRDGFGPQDSGLCPIPDDGL
jgi:hypothetical protein